MTDATEQGAPISANENADPFATVGSSLESLYLLRQEMLAEDPATMTFERRRHREEALKKFNRAEVLLLREL
jgi:hypothetical protein